MLKKLKTKMKKWFTLVELMVVIIIIWILIAAASAVYINYITKAKFTNAQSKLDHFSTSIQSFNQKVVDSDMGYTDGANDLYKKGTQVVFRKVADDTAIASTTLGTTVSQNGTNLQDLLKNNYVAATQYYTDKAITVDNLTLKNKGTYVVAQLDDALTTVQWQITLYCEAWTAYNKLDDYNNMWQKAAKDVWTAFDISTLKTAIEWKNFDCLVKVIPVVN